MEARRNSENNEMACLELVLEEFTREQKLQAKSVNDLVSAVNSLSRKFENFEEDLQKKKPVSDVTNIQPLQDIVRKGIFDLKLIVSTQPKPVVRKFQLLLFPEQDAKLFYKIVFGRWFLWLALVLFLANLYKLTIHFSDNQKEIKLQMLKNDRIKKAWDFLYFHKNKAAKEMMDSAYAQIPL